MEENKVAIKPEIREIEIIAITGQKMKVVVVPNSIRTDEEIRDSYIQSTAELKTKRVTEKQDELCAAVLKASGFTKDQLINELLTYKMEEITKEAEMIVDKDRANRKEVVEEKANKLKEKTRKQLLDKPEDEIITEVATMRLNTTEIIETLNKVWDVILLNCVRDSENRKKYIFSSLADIKETIDSETKDTLVKEHNRINNRRTETEAKN